MKEIPLNRVYKNCSLYCKYTAIVDDDDFESLNIYNWQYCNGYARGFIKGKWIKMHNFIMGFKTGKIIDHKDMNKLNNQKNNLRFCTTSQNGMNKIATGSSKYLGVGYLVKKKTYYRKITNDYKTIILMGVWRVIIKINGIDTYIGQFRNEKNAAVAYDAYARIYHGEFARLNFPEINIKIQDIDKKFKKNNNFLA
jgi:hypothetical protein